MSPFNPMLRRAMDKADMPTTPSLKAVDRPSLDQLRDTIHQCRRRVKEIEERELKEARADLTAAQQQMIEALQASDLGIEEMEHR